MNITDIDWRSSADSMPALIWVAGTDSLCVWFNKAWLEFTGKRMKQEVANGWAQGVHPDDLQRCITLYLDHFNKREHFLIEYRLRRRDGKYRTILDSGAPVFVDGEFLGYHGVCFDITDQNR